MRLSNSLAIVASGQMGLSSPYDCHVYAVRAPEGLVLIDAGSGFGEQAIAAHLAADFPHLPVLAVLLSHTHLDHSGGATGLRSRFGCRIIASADSAPTLRTADEERSGLRRVRDLGGYPADMRMKPFEPDALYRNGELLRLAGQTFEPILVRGHSHDSFCLLTTIDSRIVCFSADCLFYGGVLGLIHAADSSITGYDEDLPQLASRSIEVLLPGHGLFTMHDGQRHIDAALRSLRSGFLPLQIGQGAPIF